MPKADFPDWVAPFLDREKMLRQMVVYRFAGYRLLIHPNMEPILDQLKRDMLSVVIPARVSITSGVLNSSKPNMIRAGMGIEFVTPRHYNNHCFASRHPFAKKFEKYLAGVGLVEASRGAWVVPDEMIRDWLLAGTFCKSTWQINQHDAKTLSVLKEDFGIVPKYKQPQKKGIRERTPVGTRSKPSSIRRLL